MKRVIVTGVTGVVGANLALRLLGDGYEVHLLFRRWYASWRIDAIQSRVHHREVDLDDREGSIHTLARIPADWAFHTPVREIIAAVRRAVDVAAEPVLDCIPNRGWDTNIWISNNRKIQHALGWRLGQSLGDGPPRLVHRYWDSSDLCEHYQHRLEQRV